MAFSSLSYCNTCGAANQERAVQCLVCGVPLLAPVQEMLLKQRYRVLGLVGQGGFGVVYKAEDTQFGNRLVAVKAINLGVLTAQQAVEATDAFNREVLLLSGLTHPHLPRIYDHFTDREYWYLVIDFIEGETLEQYLEQAPNGHLPQKEILDIGMQLCDVLDYLHTREPPIIFRDLKPANVMRTADGHLYLIDFGIARHFKPGQARDTMVLGSPGYAAPEQYGRAQTTPRADIYSLGVLLYQLLTGNNPAETPFRFALSPLQSQSVPDRFLSLILRMVEVDANERPASIAAVRPELEQISAISRPMGTVLSSYRGHSRLILGVAWSPDGTRIVSGASDGTVHLWDVATAHNMLIWRHPSKFYAWTCALAWSPDGAYIACGSDDRTVRVWQVEASEVVAMKHCCIYRGHANWINAVAWSPDGTHIASGSDDKTVQVWQMEDAAIEYQSGICRGYSHWVAALAWSPDGNYIASGGNDATIQIWNVVEKKRVLMYHGHSWGVNALSWSPDSRRIASCSWDDIVRVWDVTTGNTLFTYDGHINEVKALSWSPDGTRIASAGKDKTVQVWDAAAGDLLFTYHGHSSWVYAVAWSPDGTRIASAGNDKTVQVWQAI
ncbi:MAG TPA: serine/threonine-protein kinase [Ktedonobacteraceae bacterium]|nr:serine/threonine-protein kinase [Ktedonobacteraceae bacterium]